MKYREKHGSKEAFISYLELISKVAKINFEAAEYLMSKECRSLQPFYYCGCLLGVMIWSTTPQGVKFWNEISEELGE
jgi:hypothetical protein